MVRHERRMGPVRRILLGPAQVQIVAAFIDPLLEFLHATPF